jgi:hypothetical protein
MIDYTQHETSQPPPLTDANIIRKICAMPTPAKMDIVLKFTEMPKARFGAGVVSFALEVDDRKVLVEVKTKSWRKLETAVAEWPSWIATIQGQMGPEIEGGFQLVNAGLQVFERKPKAPKEEPAPEAKLEPEKTESQEVQSIDRVELPAPLYPKLKLKTKKSGG